MTREDYIKWLKSGVANETPHCNVTHGGLICDCGFNDDIGEGPTT